MNITFLIGNGFDLNLKLKTRYSDFYEYYIENDPNDLLSKSIKSDYEMWSDLELGIGKFLETIDEGQVEEFLDSKRTLERMLSEYLALESKRFVVENEDALNFVGNVIGALLTAAFGYIIQFAGYTVLWYFCMVLGVIAAVCWYFAKKVK